MAKISTLPTEATILTGAEQLELEQGLVSRRLRLSTLSAWMTAGGALGNFDRQVAGSVAMPYSQLTKNHGVSFSEWAPDTTGTVDVGGKFLQFLQACVAAKVRGRVEPGTYKIGPTVSLTSIQADLTLEMEPGAVLKGTAEDSGPVLSISGNAIARLTIIGGTIDNGDRPFLDAVQSGTALGLSSLRSVRLDNVQFGRRTRLGTELFGDSGVTAVNCDNVTVTGCLFYGQPDLGIYVSGGGLTSTSDDHMNFVLIGNHFINCRGAAAVKRAFRRTIMIGNTLYNCQYGLCSLPALSTPNTLLAGHQGVISGNVFKYCQEANIWLYGPCYGWVISDNVIEDNGFDSSLVIAPNLTDASAIYIEGGASCLVHHNIIRVADVLSASGIKGINVTNSVVYFDTPATPAANVIVKDNYIKGTWSACVETGAIANTNIVWRENSITGATVPMTVPSARRWQYRDSNREYEGVGTTLFEADFTPVVSFVGSSPPISYVSQYGRSIRRGNTATAWVRLTYSATHALTTEEFRITGFPWAHHNDGGVLHRSGGVMGAWSSGVSLPANTVQVAPKMIAGGNYVRIESLTTSAGNVIWAASNLPTATNHTIEFQITYEVATEAIN